MKKPQQTWLLWQKSRALRVRPSEILCLELDSYEAYCLDEAVVFFGLQLENLLEKAGHKPGKEEKRAQAARERILDTIFDNDAKKSSGFADPALMF